MRNFRLELEYDGTAYRGWQRLPGTQNTIQGKLEAALSRLCGQSVTVSGSGRTDAGAHAKGQVVSFQADTPLSCEQLLVGLRQTLPEDIGARSLVQAAPRFHARLNASCKTYCYRVWTSLQPCVFARRYVYVAPAAYDLAGMRQAAQLFVGQHDFAGFCANKRGKKSTVRTIDTFALEQTRQELRFTVTGDGFLQQMVRIMVGTLLEVGLHRRDPESIVQIFASGRRADAGYTVPAKGLCLMKVEYH